MKKIVGYENEKAEIKQLKNMLIRAKHYRMLGIRIPRGLVLFGEPGVGKTQLAKSIEGGGINIVELRAANCCEDAAAESLQEVFATAKQNQPAVILLDELDKIAGTSDRFFMETNNDIQKILLQELDSLSDEDTVLVVATCNDTEMLGDALLRSGRFDRQIHVEVPDEETRELILKEYFGKLKIKKELDYKYLSRILPGYSGAKIECLANETGIKIIESNRKKITVEDVREVMNKLAFSGYAKTPVKDKERLKMIATHEAGHVVVALALTPDSIFGASVLPQGDSNGHIHFVNRDDGISTVKDIEKEVTVLLAGHVAERVALGEYAIGSGRDLAQAESRLRFLTTNQGAYGYDSIVGSSSVRYDIINDDESKAISRKIIAEKLNLFDKKAEEIIEQNRKLFDKIVEELMEKQSLTREELIFVKSEYRLKEKSTMPHSCSTIRKCPDSVAMLTCPSKVG